MRAGVALEALSGRYSIHPELFIFYTIATWTARKSVWNTVWAYLSEFRHDEPVLLIVKTSPMDDTAGWDDGTTLSSVQDLVSEVPDSASVELVTREMSDAEIRGLERRGDCFVSLCRSEGWGLPSFDAATRGTPVVMTGFGGQLEYLDNASAFLVDYDLTAVDDPAGGESYTPDQSWAEPDVEHASALLRQVYDDPLAARARGALAGRRIVERYSPERVASSFLAALGRLLEPRAG